MILAPPKVDGIAIICDLDSNVDQVLVDQLGLADCFPIGRHFSACLDSSSVVKSLHFLSQIRAREAAFEWDLQIAPKDGPVRILCFDGCVVNDSLLILGAATRLELLSFLDELMRIQSEQVNQVRQALKELSRKEAAAGRWRDEYYNELSRVNNDLASAQRELTKQNVELERLNLLKTQFFGIAAHDLRSPIGAILTFSNFLRQDAAGALTAEQIEFLSLIQGSSEFMVHLIDEFLDVSAIECARLQLDRRFTDPRKLLEHSVLLNSAMAREKRIQVTLQIEGALPTLLLDSAKIEQVLNNLLSNAVKFSLPGTAVEVRAAAEGTGLLIVVRDQGPGIPENELVNLFQYFSMTDVRATGGGNSSALGLAIVRKIVEAHGGRIWVESQIGVGSVFFLALPA
jgi:signal transduction histidine kinase